MFGLFFLSSPTHCVSVYCAHGSNSWLIFSNCFNSYLVKLQLHCTDIYSSQSEEDEFILTFNKLLFYFQMDC